MRKLSLVVLLTAFIGGPIGTAPILASAETVVEPISSDCSVEERSTVSSEYTIEALTANPLPLAGNFPSPSLDPGGFGVEYSVEPHEDEMGLVYLDGIPWLGSGRTGSRIDEALPVPFPTLVGVIGFLGEWSTCAAVPRKRQLASLLTDFGMGWACSPGDPFRVRDTPVTAVCDGPLSRAKGSLPLELYEARLLSDSRVAIIVGEGTNHTEEGLIIDQTRVGSLWVLDLTAEGWRIDAVVGGFEIIQGDWIVI